MRKFNQIKRITTVLGISLYSLSAFSQENNTTFSLGLTSDQFFGVAPSVSVDYQLNDKLAFTAYGIFWGTGTAAAWGNWTEFGVGINYALAEGVTINPNLGFTFGNLLSKGAADGQMGGIAGDGIVPNVFFNVNKPKFESEVYVGYYAPLRDEAPDDGSTLAYLHYWANAGYRVSSVFSVGGHFEHLRRTKDDVNGKLDYYQWLGPYVQFSVPKFNSFLRLAAGPELKNGLQKKDSFYKLSTGFSF
ncbi:hypothetical protein GQF61_15365 [Sphingobacterium sp. DK4209]|uniref:Outer membrane beta-barrel protein n=1 Tax=Sphingobacterium zhuxiongii TaxID=2662364 RepID=A0A5Q0QH82_9SPHI|nr:MULTISPECIES: DUF6733 family protein [unclassified Sphingobacterium]MVZ67238.1 hypothetical protein [Sphingobacterium sp. DK4209]QGA26740.1 hypothetical protein GFH32_10575 [Sphingobacterium sp. dk4302]